jgi:hypothetical protein
MNKLEALLAQIKGNSESISFQAVIETIDESYTFTPTGFKNGYTYNEAGQNNGSCKVFSFAQMNNLSASETLNLFGDYYRIDVLDHPEKDDHANIRNFIKFGWSGIEFENAALIEKI